MRITRLASLAFAASLLAGVTSTAYAQEPAAPASQEKAKDEAKVQSISGELVKVDTEKKILSVKMADGAEWAFDYTSSTEISGSKGEQGLATAQGSKVVVHYKTADDKKIATKVEVQPPPPAK